jgi:hypothetical protein
MILTGETQVLGEKPVPFAHSPPEASKGRRQIRPGSRYGRQSTVALSCTYLEKFMKSTNPAAESSAKTDKSWVHVRRFV